MFKKTRNEDVYTDIGKKLKMTMSSISEGNTEGVLWSYDEKTYFIWDRGNIVLYIFGEKSTRQEDLHEFFEDEIKRDASKEGFSYFKVNDRTGLSLESIKSIFGNGKVLEKYFYEYRGGDVFDFSSDLDVKVIDIDEQFLTNTDLLNLDKVVNEVKWMWPSFERFFEKGFGKAAVFNESIVCWCTAEYVSENMCGIGIETLEDFRREGIATVTAVEFIRDCLDNDMIPFWDCSADNTASVGLAEKLGFDKIDESRVLLGKF